MTATYVGVVAALLIGFLGGLLTFRIKQRWCPACGAGLACAACTGGTEVRRASAPRAAR